MRLRILFLTTALALAPSAARADWRSFHQPERRVRVATALRLYNAGIDDHIFVTDPKDVETAQYIGWDYEGPVFGVATEPGPGLVPMYRYLQPYSGGHSYTTDPNPARPQLQREYLLGYISPRPGPGLVPLYVWHNPDSGRYFYTLDREGELAPDAGYRPKGILGYVFAPEEGRFRR
jgi:hypothetical protein